MRFNSKRMRLGLVATVALTGLLVGAVPSFAGKDDGGADEKIQKMTVQLKELEVKDDRNAATSELGQVEALVTKARSIVGERKERDALGQTLDEAEATLSLAEAKIIEADKQAALDEQKKQLAATKGKVKSTKDKVAELEKEQAALDGKLEGGK